MHDQTQPPLPVGKQFPCGSCGAKLEFSPGAATLKCPYCGHENQIPQSSDDIQELDFNEYFSRAGEQSDAQEVQTVTCHSCGATSTLQPNISMSHCPFCGTQLQAPASRCRWSSWNRSTPGIPRSWCRIRTPT